MLPEPKANQSHFPVCSLFKDAFSIFYIIFNCQKQNFIAILFAKYNYQQNFLQELLALNIRALFKAVLEVSIRQWSKLEIL